VPHVLLEENWLAFVPLTPMLVMLSVPVPVLVSVTVSAALVPTGWVVPKLRLAGLTVRTGAVPVPARFTVCEVLPPELPELSVIVTVAALAPVEVGLKVTEMAHWVPAFRLGGHVLVCWNWLAFAPPSTMPVLALMLSGALPVLEIVTVCTELIVPDTCVPKARLAGLTSANGSACPVPVRAVPKFADCWQHCR